MKKNFIVYSPSSDSWSDVICENNETDAIKCLEDGGWLDDRDTELKVYEVKDNPKPYPMQHSWKEKGTF